MPVVRTIIFDDSASMRAMIGMALAQDPGIEVVGSAATVSEARALIRTLDPDVLTLDIEMPDMDGLAFLERVMRLRPMPVVMLSRFSARGTELALQALELGAYDCMGKPGDTDFADFQDELIATVKAAARSRPLAHTRSTAAVAAPVDYVARPDALIAIGASTGGVEALLALLKGFPETCPPTVMVQHMPATFTTSFAARLDRMTRPRVVEARSGMPLRPGHVYLAPAGAEHLEIVGTASLRCRMVAGDRINGHRPSVDHLFHSVAQTAGASAVGVILTGMGNDGARGLKTMRNRGATTIGQDERTCVVYGMPAAARQIDAVQVELPLPRIAQRALQACRA